LVKQILGKEADIRTFTNSQQFSGKAFALERKV
jgi:hypothetical protein